MKPQDVQIPKGMKLTCTIADFSRISEFKEPEDVINVGGSYYVCWRWGTYNGKPLERSRKFHSKTYADNFVALLQSCFGVVIISGPTYKSEAMLSMFKGMRFVDSSGAIAAAIRELEL